MKVGDLEKRVGPTVLVSVFWVLYLTWLYRPGPEWPRVSSWAYQARLGRDSSAAALATSSSVGFS